MTDLQLPDVMKDALAKINGGITRLDLTVKGGTTHYLLFNFFLIPTQGSKIGDKGVSNICEALKTNTTLVELNFNNKQMLF